jgi:hypothetical protein
LKEKLFQGLAFVERVAQSPWCWDSAALPVWHFTVFVTEELFNIKSRRVAKAATLRHLLRMVSRAPRQADLAPQRV